MTKENVCPDAPKPEELHNEERLMEYYKRYANGEQNLILTEDDEILEKNKDFYWELRTVYNRTIIAVEKVKCSYLGTSASADYVDKKLYGRDGLVERLKPIQDSYNKLMNSTNENLLRTAYPNINVEDGSIDIDNLVEEGMSPGKVLVYRQGSTPPETVYSKNVNAGLFEAMRQALLDEFDAITDLYIVKNFVGDYVNLNILKEM